MADLNFEEHCPCGATIKIGGWASEVRTQVQTWRGIHNKHANAAAKAKKEADYDLISVDMAEPTLGLQVGRGLLRTHGPGSCRGPLDKGGNPICCIHNPSDHHMRSWRQNWRGDKSMMERICPHGVGHPDPDDLSVRTTQWAGVHGCDGCCVQEAKDEPPRDL